MFTTLRKTAKEKNSEVNPENAYGSCSSLSLPSSLLLFFLFYSALILPHWKENTERQTGNREKGREREERKKRINREGETATERAEKHNQARKEDRRREIGDNRKRQREIIK